MSYLCTQGHLHRDPQRAVNCSACRRQERRSRKLRLTQHQKDEAAIKAAILRLFHLHQGGNDPNPQYAQMTKQVVRKANGAYKRLFGKGTGATHRSRS